MGYYKIADIVFEIKNINYNFFHKRMKAYKLCDTPTSVDVVISYEERDNIEITHENSIALKNNRYWVYENDEYILYDYYEEFKKTYSYIKANNDWSIVECIISDATNEFDVPNEVRSFNILSLVMQNVILFHNGIVLHSSAIAYKNKGIAFFAPSGTGKSTHTRLWKKYYDDVEIINDDSPAVRIIDGKYLMYGTPWSGKTDININKSTELSAIVFLRQAYENSIRKVNNPIEALQVILPEIYKPAFDDMANLNMDMLDILIKNIPMYVLYCNISKEAVDTVKNEIIKQ